MTLLLMSLFSGDGESLQSQHRACSHTLCRGRGTFSQICHTWTQGTYRIMYCTTYWICAMVPCLHISFFIIIKYNCNHSKAITLKGALFTIFSRISAAHSQMLPFS